MGKTVPDWQTFIQCTGATLTIRHLKSGLAEDLEIPWPEKLRFFECEKVRFCTEALQPLTQYGETLESVTLKNCEITLGALSVLAQASALRWLNIENCGVSDDDFAWFKGTGKLAGLVLTGNTRCTGTVVAKAAGSPLHSLYLNGTDFRDTDLPLIHSFPGLQYLDVSETKVTGAALPQLAENRGLTIFCDHDRDGVSQFRTAQRQKWKKKLACDENLARETIQFVADFYAASQNSRQPRSRFVTRRYLDYCKTHGYSGVDPEQKVSFGGLSASPYQDFQVVDVEQITGKKFYVYSQCDDRCLTQYRCIVVRTEDGWKIDKNERLADGKWTFYSLK